MKTHTRALRGVNLGGWLLLERWMTPRLFDGTEAQDEYTFMQTEGAVEKVERHRQTFIRESDFRWLADHGIEAIRIPFGYWIFDGDGPYRAAITHLDWAVRVAEKYKLKILLDLHGAKGSQNGKDHSGRAGRAGWFRERTYRKQTIEVLTRIAERYYHNESVWGIELLNEPRIGLLQPTLRRFYNQAYDALLKVTRPGMYIIFHDAFTPRLMNGAVIGSHDLPVAMDVHWYQFGSLFHRFQTMAGYFRKLDRRMKLLRRLQLRQPVIVGEWSVVLTGKILAGAPPELEKEWFRAHAARQLRVYDTALAWFYWTYKTEDRGIWHFRSQVEDGIIMLDTSPGTINV